VMLLKPNFKTSFALVIIFSFIIYLEFIEPRKRLKFL
jgi:hypothetical protein